MKTIYLFMFILVPMFSFSQYFSDSTDFKNRGAFSDILIPDSTNTVWQNGVSTKFDSLNNSPTLITDSLNSYPVNVKEFVYMKVCENDFSVASYEINFTHRFNTDTLSDGGFIEMSFDTGQTWVNVLDYQDGTISFPYVLMFTDFNTSSVVPLLGDSSKSSFHGDGSKWRTNYIHVQFWYAIKTNYDSICPFPMWLRFGFTSDSVDNNKQGWEIGKVVVLWDTSFGIDESKMISFNVSPNPAKNKVELNLELQPNEGLEYKITNMLGQTVEEGILENNHLEIETEFLPPGSYFIILPKLKRYAKFIKL